MKEERLGLVFALISLATIVASILLIWFLSY